MVHCRMDVGEKEQAVLMEIQLSKAVNVKKRKLARIFFGILAIVCLGFLLWIWRYVGTAQRIEWILLAGVSSLLALRTKQFQKGVLKLAVKLAKVDPSLRYGRREYTFSEDGIQISSDYGEGNHYWNSLDAWGECQGYLYVRMKSNAMMLVDESRLTAEELAEVKELLESHLSKEM